MVAFKNILFFGLAVSASVLPAVQRRQLDTSSAVLSGLKKTDADTVSLSKANTGFDPSNPTTAGPIAADVLIVESDIVATSTTAKLSVSNFTESGAQAIIDFINNSLEPDTAYAISTLEANKGSIASSGFLPVVQAQLTVLKLSVDDLATSIEAKTPSDKLSAAKNALSKLQQDYANAQAYFAS